MSDKNVYKKIYKAVVREGVREREQTIDDFFL